MVRIATNVGLAVILQILLLKWNEKIEYGFEQKKLSVFLVGILGVLAGLLKTTMGLSVLYSVLFVCLVNISLVDYKYYEIPDSYNLAVLIIGIINVIILKDFTMVLMGLVSFFLFLVVSILSGGALGGGDIKLSLGLGLFFNTLSFKTYLIYVFGVGALISLVLLVTKKKQRDDRIPFGPFMAIGAMCTILI